jgi:hypothetical protein
VTVPSRPILILRLDSPSCSSQEDTKSTRSYRLALLPTPFAVDQSYRSRPQSLQTGDDHTRQYPYHLDQPSLFSTRFHTRIFNSSLELDIPLSPSSSFLRCFFVFCPLRPLHSRHRPPFSSPCHCLLTRTREWILTSHTAYQADD